jgi:hypothetical protein
LPSGTGDPVFDDTLKAALGISLRQSPFLNVLPDRNDGRGAMFKISTKEIAEVPNGTDGVLILTREVQPWPEWSAENVARMKTISKRLGGVGLRVESLNSAGTRMRSLIARVSCRSNISSCFSHAISLFLGEPYLKLRPILMALGEQNSGKSTLFEPCTSWE